MAKECKLQNNVYIYCGEKIKYHSSLCPNKFGITKKFGTERNGKVEKITPQKHNLVAVRKKLVMQPRLATVYNPEILHSEEARILMDTGSQEAYITKQETYN